MSGIGRNLRLGPSVGAGGMTISGPFSLVDASNTISYLGQNWTANAPDGYLEIRGGNLIATVVNPMPAAIVDTFRNPVPERCFLTAGFFTGIGLASSTHISFGMIVLPGPIVTGLFCDLFQLMISPDTNPATGTRFFPSPMLEMEIQAFQWGGVETLIWETRYDPTLYSTNPNPNFLVRSNMPLVRGQRMTWDIDIVNSQGGPGGSLKIVMNKGLSSELTVVNVTNTPIGFNTIGGSYPSIGCYKDHTNTPGEVTSVVFDSFSLVNTP